jgi:CheY-like chemotaxis protein
MTDYLMPRMTGVEFAKSIWKIRPDIPAILAAGFGGQLDEPEVKAHGFRCFLPKPFSVQTLSDVIRQSLEPIGK